MRKQLEKQRKSLERDTEVEDSETVVPRNKYEPIGSRDTAHAKTARPQSTGELVYISTGTKSHSKSRSIGKGEIDVHKCKEEDEFYEPCPHSDRNTHTSAPTDDNHPQ